VGHFYILLTWTQTNILISGILIILGKKCTILHCFALYRDIQECNTDVKWGHGVTVGVGSTLLTLGYALVLV